MLDILSIFDQNFPKICGESAVQFSGFLESAIKRREHGHRVRETIGRLTHLSSTPDTPSAFANSEPHAAALIF
ncbi:hypothetical protein [Maricaulis sp.]|uniref:hypothetical protein n=1 Tax=Maricaulis sp. TaxID=1486257 RepID=UPI00329A6B5F